MWNEDEDEEEDATFAYNRSITGGGRAYRGLQGWVGLNDSAPEHLSALRFLPRFLS
jgi:hypothetical protein